MRMPEREGTIMRRLRIVAVFALLAAPLNLPVSRAVAQGVGSPEATQAATELFALLSKDMLSQLNGQMTAQLWPLMDRDLPANIDAAGRGQLRAEFERIQLTYLTDIMKDAPAVYARHFTAQELRELAMFYRTPTGQKALKEMPQVMADTFAIVMPRLRDIEAQTAEAFAKVLRDRGYGK
jgi:hypothetical protein